MNNQQQYEMNTNSIYTRRYPRKTVNLIFILRFLKKYLPMTERKVTASSISPKYFSQSA